MPSRDAQEARLPNNLLLNRNFVLLWLAYGVAAMGDHLSEMALLRASGGLERTDATRVQALMNFAFFLPFVLIAPLTGWWADRFERRFTMIAADLIRAGIVFSLAWVVTLLLGAGLGDYGIALPILVVGAFAAFFSPCRQSMLPAVVRDDQLVRANALMSAFGAIGAILSGIIGGYLVDLAAEGELSLSTNYYVNTGTFITSAVCLFLMAPGLIRRLPHPPLDGIVKPVANGFQYVWTHRRVLQMILLGAVFWAAAGVIYSVMPAFVRDIFAGGYTDVAMYRGLIVVGLTLGSAVMTAVGPHMPVQLRVVTGLAGGIIWTLGLLVSYALAPEQVSSAAEAAHGAPWWLRIFAGLCLVGIGGAGAALLVTMMASLQQFVPDAKRGRVFGVSDMCTMAGWVIATAIIGLPHIPNLDRLIPWLLAIVAVLFAIALIAAMRIYLRRLNTNPVTLFMWWFVRFYAYFWCRLDRANRAPIPRRGPCIVAANHTSGIDWALVQATSSHRLVSWLIAKEYVTGAAAWFMALAKCVAIDREKPSKSELQAARAILDRGDALGIFPTGTFEIPGEPLPELKAGVARLALRANVPIIPCHISGTQYFDSPHRALFSRHRARIHWGAPIDPAAFADAGNRREAADALAAHLAEAIQRLAPDAGATGAHKQAPLQRSGTHTAD